MPTHHPTPRELLAATCRHVGLARPRPRRRRDTWIREAIGAYREEHLDLLWLERAQAYFAAAWAASRRRDAETCERMLHGGLAMLRLGDEWAYYETYPVSENDPDLRGLGLIFRAIPDRLKLEQAGAEGSLVVYQVDETGPVIGNDSWMEGFGLDCDGYMLDDGRYREAFVEPRDAAEAARSWETRPRRGRGLPYLDTAERMERRMDEARSPETPPERLVELATDPRDEILMALVENEAAPTEALLAVAESGFEVRLELAERRGLPREVVATILEAGDQAVSGIVVANGHFTPEVAEALGSDEELVQWLDYQGELERLSPEALRIIARWPRWREEVMALPSYPQGSGEERAPSSILRRSYTIRRWVRWDDELHGFATEFQEVLGVFPNILLANEVTYARIDMAARKQHIRDDDGTTPQDGEHTPLGSFVGPDYVLEFAIDPRLGDARVSLIYDCDPDGGGEPVPDEDTVVEAVAPLSRTLGNGS